MLVDAQLDARQRELFRIAFDPLDVPREQFLVAGDAWQRCRAGKADPSAFGILDMHGLWFIAGNVIRDVAALNNHEMLPWDVWGAMARTDAEVDIAFIDRLAALTVEPDAPFRRAARDLPGPARGRARDSVQRRPQPSRSRSEGGPMQAHKTVSREEWLEARRALLAKEKALLKAKDELRRETPRAALGEGRQGLCVRGARTARRRCPTCSPAAAS